MDERTKFEQQLVLYASQSIFVDDFSVYDNIFQPVLEELLKFVSDSKREDVQQQFSLYQNEFKSYWMNNRPLEARLKRIINQLYKNTPEYFLKPVNDIRSHLLNILSKLVVKDGYFVFYILKPICFNIIKINFGQKDIDSCFREGACNSDHIYKLDDLGGRYIGIVKKSKDGIVEKAGRCWLLPFYERGVFIAFNTYGDFYSLWDVMYPVARMIEKYYVIQTRMAIISEELPVYVNGDKFLIIYDIEKYENSQQAYDNICLYLRD